MFVPGLFPIRYTRQVRQFCLKEQARFSRHLFLARSICAIVAPDFNLRLGLLTDDLLEEAYPPNAYCSNCLESILLELI
jgi:hypothetical protein